MKKIFYLLLVFLALSSCKCNKKQLTYEDLVNRMTDFVFLATLPQEGEEGAMWSSYDRESRYDSASDSYINWDANADGYIPQYIRKEGDDIVIAEMEGPGCIWRIWSAMPEDGHVKIYLDSSKIATIDIPFKEYFDTVHEAFNFPELVYTSARGNNNYVPIPYQKYCKIVAEPGWGKYYHINYSTFPKDFKVPTFNFDMSQEDMNILKKANDFISQRGYNMPYEKVRRDEEVKGNMTLNSGNNCLFDIKGKHAIKSIKFNMNFSDRKEQELFLRKTVIQIRWDGEKEPSVWCPLGDFFGTAPGVNKFKTLPLGMTDEGFYCYWYMPFAESAVMELVNESGIKKNINYEIVYGKVKGDIEDYGRFHAKWHRDIFPVGDSRFPDWTVLITKGSGRYVGMMLNVWNPRGNNNIDAGRGSPWWGEGDEKFFVDGEKFPSTYGTGTEDYFGYAWGEPSFFEKAFHSQSMTQGNEGYQSLCRWHFGDNVPFQKSFDGYLEKYYSNSWPTQYSCVVYWYLSPGGTDTIIPVPVEERYGYETPFIYKGYVEKDAVEAENFNVVENTGNGGCSKLWGSQLDMDNISSGRFIIWYSKSSDSSRLKIEVNIKEDGKYDLISGFVRYHTFGIFQLYVDDIKTGNLVDLFCPENQKFQKVKLILGKVDLKKGKHVVCIEPVGANRDITKKESKGPGIGIDFIKFEKNE